VGFGCTWACPADVQGCVHVDQLSLSGGVGVVLRARRDRNEELAGHAMMCAQLALHFIDIKELFMTIVRYYVIVNIKSQCTRILSC
jgi:hypothetical protein